MSNRAWLLTTERLQVTDPSGGVIYLDGGSTEARIGASVPMLLQPDTPGSGSGRNLTLSASPGAGANPRGNLLLDLGGFVGGLSGPLTILSSSESVEIRLESPDVWRLHAQGQTRLSVKFAGYDFVDYDSERVALTLNTYDMSGSTVGLTLSDRAVDIAFVQEQNTSTSGSPWLLRAQRGFAGSVGGNLNLGVGLGGTQGTDLPGDLNLLLGYPTGSRTGRLRVTSDDTDKRVFDAYFDVAVGSGVMEFYAGNANGPKIFTQGSQLLHLDLNSLTDELGYFDSASGATTKRHLRRAGRATTTSTTTTTVVTIPASALPSGDYSATVWVSITGYDTSANQVMSDCLRAHVRRTSGITTVVGSVRYAIIAKEGAGTAVICSLTQSSGDLLARITAPDSNNSRWHGFVQVEAVAY